MCNSAHTHSRRHSAYDLHLEFHGHAHTACDIFVFCPKYRVAATGNASHGWLPNIGMDFHAVGRGRLMMLPRSNSSVFSAATGRCVRTGWG